LTRCALIYLLCACGAQLSPETLVKNLRVLSVVAEPPEVKPAQSTALSILELDPSRPGGKTTVIWVGCEPDPIDFNRSACNDTRSLLQPTSFSTFPPGVKILGFGLHASYASDAHLFDRLSADDPVRQNGTAGPVLAVVIGEEINPTANDDELRALFHRIETQEVKAVMALTRVMVSERDDQNHNPYLDGIYVDEVGLPPGATIQVEPGQQAALHFTGQARESYTLLLPEGPDPRTESLVAAVYSSSGRFDRERVDLTEGPDTIFTAPGSSDVPEDPVPEKRNGTIWVVLRDGRGGQSFTQFPFFVCDDALPDPLVSQVDVQPDRLTFSGTNLSSVLDVIIEGRALAHGGYSPSRDVFIADTPSLPPGSYPVKLRTKNCGTADTSLMLVLP
jgi:hypothetical protein